MIRHTATRITPTMLFPINIIKSIPTATQNRIRPRARRTMILPETFFLQYMPGSPF